MEPLKIETLFEPLVFFTLKNNGDKMHTSKMSSKPTLVLSDRSFNVRGYTNSRDDRAAEG